MVRPKKAPSRKNKPHRTLRCGNVSVNVYRIQREHRPAYFQVADYTQGSRRLRTFSDEAKAINEGKRIARSLAKGDATAAKISNAQAAALARATEQLDASGDPIELAAARYAEAVKILGSGALLTTAAKDYARRHPVNLPSMAVTDAVTELLSVKQNRGASPRYLDDLRSRLDRFAQSFKTTVASVDTKDIQGWLDSLKLSPQSYKNFRTVLHSLFEFCIARQYVIDNPVSGIERPKVKQSDKGIYTPNELRKLITNADQEFLPYLVIGAFAGLRTSEIERLEWSDIRGDAIHVTAGKAKTASRRIVPISDNLKRFLTPYGNCEGKVWASKRNRLYNQQKYIAKLAETRWKQNALRHSYASYRLAIVKNEAQVAYELGNSAAVVHRHYKELVSETQAHAWFSITPIQSENIVHLREQSR